MKGPALVLVPSLTAKVKWYTTLMIGVMAHFCDAKNHFSTNTTKIICSIQGISLNPCWGSAKKRLQEILRTSSIIGCQIFAQSLSQFAHFGHPVLRRTLRFPYPFYFRTRCLPIGPWRGWEVEWGDWPRLPVWLLCCDPVTYTTTAASSSTTTSWYEAWEGRPGREAYRWRPNRRPGWVYEGNGNSLWNFGFVCKFLVWFHGFLSRTFVWYRSVLRSSGGFVPERFYIYILQEFMYVLCSFLMLYISCSVRPSRRCYVLLACSIQVVCELCSLLYFCQPGPLYWLLLSCWALVRYLVC